MGNKLAYMTEFRPWCKADGCQIKPTWWVRDVDGTQLGHYCKRHAKQRVAEINEFHATSLPSSARREIKYAYSSVERR